MSTSPKASTPQNKMDEDNTHSCPICYEEYDTDERVPCIGLCGHTICNSCRSCMLTSKCPLCNRKEAFAVMVVNRQLMDLTRFLQIVQNRAVAEKKPHVRGNCTTCHENSNKLRVCIKCMMTEGVLNSQGKMENAESIQDVSRNMRKMAMCGDCVLDNGHFEHNTILIPKSMTGFRKFYDERMEAR